MGASLNISAKETSYSVDDNTSQVQVSVSITWNYGSFNRNKCYGYIKCDSKIYEFNNSFNYSASNSGSETLASYTFTISHNNDGKKTVSCEAYFETGVSSGNIDDTTTLKLTDIPRNVTLTSAPNFNDEQNPKITYSNPAGSSITTLQAAIYSSDGETAYAAYRNITKTASSYTFSLTSAERTALRSAAKSKNSISVRFYIRYTLGSTTKTTYLTKTLSIINATPTITPSVVDTNDATILLTGSNQTLVKYYSNASITIGAKALKSASISSQKAVCGAKSISTATGTISKVESGTFTFTVKDSRGNSATKTLEKTFVDYVKLTNNFRANLSVDGLLTIRIFGNYYNGSFGAVDNTLNLSYRYKTEDGAYGNWIAVTPTYEDKSYESEISFSLPDFDYKKSYTFQTRAVDKLTTINSSEYTVRSLPVFDWGASDFNFNVPVNVSYNNNSYSLLGLLYAMTTTYRLDCDVTAGANYSAVTATADLIGNNLRIGITATRSSAVSVGNVTNETVATLLIDHGGKLNNLYRVSFNSSTEGGAATFDAQASKVDDNTVKVTINLCATTTAATGWNAYFAMPCTITTKAYV